MSVNAEPNKKSFGDADIDITLNSEISLNSKQNSSPSPIDKYNLVYYICVLIGVGNLLPYNIVITCSDYLTNAFPDHSDIEFDIVPIYQAPAITITILSIFYGHLVSFKIRVIYSFIIAGLGVGFTPIIIGYISNKNISYYVFLSLVGLFGGVCSIIQSAIFGFTALLPSTYSQALLMGQAIAGIGVCILRTITKASSSSINEGAILYFAIGGAICFICSIGFLYAVKSSYTQYYLDKYYQAKLNISPTSNSMTERLLKENDDKKKINYFDVFKKIRKLALVEFGVFVITFLMFPGLLTKFDSNFSALNSGGWFALILITEFNIGDYIGRKFAGYPLLYCKFNHNNLWMLTAGRIIIYPAFIILGQQIWTNDILAYVSVFFLAVTNGQHCTLGFMWGPSLCEEHEKEVAGTILSFFLLFGITIGSVFALLINPIL